MALPKAGVELVADGLSDFTRGMKQSAAAVETLGDASAKAAAGVKAVGTSAEQTGKRVEKSADHFNVFGEIVTGALRKVGEVIVDFAMEGTRALAGFFKDSISLAGDFDQNMSVLRVTSGATAEEMEQLSAKAKELGSDLTLPATSAVNAGEAMLELAKAGFTVSEQMDAAKGVLQLAAAAQIDEARAAEINANALQAFGLAAKESIFVSDLLAASANASSINATDMADTYKMAGAIFSAFQGPVVGSKEALIDLTTAASLLGNAGIKGSDAGTALKQSLLQLTAPSDKAKGLMKALAEDIGVAGDIAYDAAGNMRSFPEILGLVSESTRLLSEEQRNYIVSTIFGADASRAILILMQQGPEAWDKMTTAVTAQGAAQQLAAAQTEGFNGAMEGAKSQVETLQLTIGQALTPVLAELLNKYVSPGIAALTDFADTFLKMGPAIAASDDPLQSFLNALKVAAPNLLDVISAVEDIKDGIQGLIASFQSGGAAAQVLGAIFDGQVKNYQTLFGTLGTYIPGILKSIETITGDVLMQITTFWKNNGDEVTATVTAAMKIIGDIYNTVLQIILTLVGDKLTTMAAYFHEHGDQIQQVIKGAWDIISGVVIAGLTLIQGALKIALDLINGDWSAAWGHLQEMSATFVLALEKIIMGFLGIIAAAWGSTLQELGETWNRVWADIVDYVSNIDWADVGMQVINGIIAGLTGGSSKLASAARKVAMDAYQAMVDFFDIGSPSKVMEEQVGVPIVQGMIAGIQGMLPELLSVVADMGDELTNAAQDIADAVSEVMQSGFTATANIDRQKLKNLKDIKGLSAGSQDAVAMQLEEAQKQAMQIADPKQAADFFKQRSAQVFELAELNDQIIAATEAGDKQLRNDLIAQYQLINAAQLNETKAAAMDRQQGGTLQQLVESVYAAMAAGLPVNDTGIGALLSSFADRAGGMISQPASAQQIAGAGGGNTYASNTSYTMPIYTNNSPAALQQSLAVAQALTPA